LQSARRGIKSGTIWNGRIIMKVRIINHVNYTEYAEVEVKDETELDEMYNNGIYDNLSWHEGKDYGETYHEILDEEVQDEKISG
tara:strand:- start:355 stop:606 length:252 start_codon:yes stop_codon:yes gene_type:complete